MCTHLRIMLNHDDFSLSLHIYISESAYFYIYMFNNLPNYTGEWIEVTNLKSDCWDQNHR